MWPYNKHLDRILPRITLDEFDFALHQQYLIIITRTLVSANIVLKRLRKHFIKYKI